jgi:starch synthase
MKIVYAASEMLPFASTGGLADVGAALPRALLKHGVQIWRVMPMYRQIIEGNFALKDAGIRLEIPVGFRVYKADIWTAEEPAPQTYFIRRDELFDRSQLYSLPERDYDDNFKRFVFFQKAIVALIDALGPRPNIVHCSDWQTGLVPFFLRHGINGMGRNLTEKIVFTIHNLAYQGIYPGSLYSLTNLPFFCFSMDYLEFFGNINCIKGGITAADVVTTISKRYTQEIRTEEFGCGLHGVLARLGDRLVGIPLGVDYSVWSPVHDSFLSQACRTEDLSGKRASKEELTKMVGLNISPETPLIGMVTRLVDQKGLDILAEAMNAMMALDVGFVILGAGQEKYQTLCRQWAEKWPGRFAVRIGYDNPLAHKIIAGSDIYMMPSRFEPCGLSQLYGLRYGTLPIVHATGGLDDTVEDVALDGSRGTGFKFKTYTADGLLSSIQRALDLYKRHDVWAGVMQRAIQQDFSWDRVAEEYLSQYRKLIS